MMIVAETYWELFHNRPHWLFELTVEVATFVALTLPIRWWVKRHDLDHPTQVEFKRLQKRVAYLEHKLNIVASEWVNDEREEVVRRNNELS